MIVRDAILCDEPYTLRADLHEYPTVQDMTQPVPSRRPQPALASVPAAIEPKPVIAAEEVALEPASLTWVTVTEWLAAQDRQTLVSAMPGLAAELEEIREDAYAAGFG